MSLLAQFQDTLPCRYYLGIDLGYKLHVAVVISLHTFLQDPKKWKKAPALEFSSTSAGFQKLLTYLTQFSPAPQAFLGLCEPTGGFYGASLFQFLLDRKYALAWVENSTTRAMREKLFGQLPKTDAMDARILARIAYLHEAVGEEFTLRPLHLAAPQDAELLQLGRDAWKLKTTLTRARNQFTQLMAVVFPELKTFFTRSVSSLAPVTLIHHYPSPPEIAAASPEELRTLLWQTGAYRHAKKIAELQALAHASVGLLPDPGRAWRLHWLSQFLLTNFQADLTLTRHLRTLIRQRPEYPLLAPIPYAGPPTLGVIIAATGDIRRFSNYRKYQAYTGYFPGLETSQTIDRTRMSKRGNRPLKRALFQIAAPLVWFDQNDNPYKALFHRKVADGKPWYKAMPFVCAALSRHVYHCLKFEEPYDVAKAFGASPSLLEDNQAARNLSATLDEKFEVMDAYQTLISD